MQLIRKVWKHYINYFHQLLHSLRSVLKWSFFGIFCGVVTGFAAAVFAKSILLVTDFRLSHPLMLFGLPFAGLFIVWLYHRGGERAKGGTNLILDGIRQGKEVPARFAPLIFASTVITHAFGGSAGREGAALQMGGSMGSALGKLLHFKKEDESRVIMCGMSAAFSALFGTPLAAAVLPMEISTVGIMYYSAMVPCALASLSAHYVAAALGLSSGALVPDLDFKPESPRIILLCLLFAAVAAVTSALFATCVHRTEHLSEKYIPNDYARIFFFGSVIVGLTFLVGNQNYNGTGSQIIAAALTKSGAGLPLFAFLLKILFTALTLGSGYRGGEIVPSLFIGATLGNAFASLVGLSPAAFAALGMGAMFCGITNCPIAALLICFEMCGFAGIPYFMIIIPVTYVLSGYYGVYSAQHVLYDKFEPGRVDTRIHE